MTEKSQVQTLHGTVSKVGSAQTIRVSVRVTKTHPIYRKRYTQLRHYLAHDPEQKAKLGDEVTIRSCRPVSKSKHWVVTERSARRLPEPLPGDTRLTEA